VSFVYIHPKEKVGTHDMVNVRFTVPTGLLRLGLTLTLSLKW